MASETTYGIVKQYVPAIWEAALMYIKYNFTMSGLLKTFSNMQGFTPRYTTQYTEGTVTSNLGELQDLTPQLITRNLLAALQPAEHGTQYVLTDRRVESDTEDILADAAEKIGYEMGKKLEVDLLTDFGNLTGGYVGSAGSSLTWQNIYEGRTRLAAAGVPAPYNVVLHEYQWHDLATAANIVSIASTSAGAAAPLTVRNDIQGRYYVASMGDMNFFTSGLVPIDGNDDATGAMFNPNALALDMRRGLRVEPQRDASLRLTELNATMVYAHGIWRPTWGVKIISDASALGTAITQNSDIAISGSVSSATAGTGVSVTYDIVIVNNSTVIATGITVTMTVPSGGTISSTETTQGEYNTTTNIWNAGSLAPGDSGRIRIVGSYSTTGTKNFVGTVSAAVPVDASYSNTGNIVVTVS